MTALPAGEQHTGNLNLTGEGQPEQGVIIPTEAILSAHDKLQERWGPVSAVPILHSDMRAALEAAAPAIRQQVAEEIAAAIVATGRYETPGRLHAASKADQDLDDARFASYKDAARIAREIGGTA